MNDHRRAQDLTAPFLWVKENREMTNEGIELQVVINMDYGDNLPEKAKEFQARIADEIVNKGNVKIVLIAGPSSSGKTTFSKRLSVQLAASGIRPFAISLDDYFVDRDHTPKDEKGEYDYESLYALDLPFFNQQLKQILAGEDVALPTYNFVTGEREFKGKHVKLTSYWCLKAYMALTPSSRARYLMNRNTRCLFRH